MKQKEVQVIVVIIVLVAGFVFSGYLVEEDETFELAKLPKVGKIGRGIPVSAPACLAGTCQSLGVGCGQVNDGCGRIIDCGTCSSGQTCWQGKCRNPGACTYNLDCGLDEPVGRPYCAKGQNIYQDIKIFQCSPQGSQSFVVPGALCTNYTNRVHLYTCPGGTTCQQGLCYKHCNQDTDCPRVKGKEDYIDQSCINNLCPVETALSITNYNYCLDNDQTPTTFNIQDPSLNLPGTILLIDQRGASYLLDYCNTKTGRLREWYCFSQQQPSSYEEIDCSGAAPFGTCQFYRTGVTNKYLTYNVNVGVCV